MKRFISLLLLSLTLCGSAFADSSSMIEIGDNAEADRKITVVVGPEALRQATAHARPGQRQVVSIMLAAGLFSGVRASVLPYQSENLTVQVEGFYGAALFSRAGGAGVRVQFPVVAGVKNAMLVSPGIDVIFSPEDNLNFLGHPNHHVFVMANADIAWLHEIAPHFGLELGARLGVGMRIDMETTLDVEDRAFLLPDVGLYTGVRF